MLIVGSVTSNTLVTDFPAIRPLPIVTDSGFVTGIAFSMHHINFSFKILIIGLIILITTAIF